jgi:hypothetical protein
MSPRIKRTTTTASGRAVLSSCRALLVIDNEPILRQALRDCRVALRQRDKARAEWEHFTQVDQPAYERWHHRQFGSTMQEVHELNQRIAEAERLLQEVQFEIFMRGGPAWEAFGRVKQAREAPPPEPEDDEDSEWDESDWEDPWGSGPEQEDPMGGSEEEVKRHLRNIFGFNDEELEAAIRRLQELGQLPKSKKPEECVRIKEVYRKLVRRLHPDLTELTDQMAAVKQELWHAVQEAYRARDLDRLESLLARCDLEEGVVSENTAISQLRKTWQEIKVAVKSIRANLRRARKDRAWGFSTQAPEVRDALRSTISRELKGELHRQTALNEKLQEEMAYLERRWKAAQEAEMKAQVVDGIDQPRGRPKTKAKSKKQSSSKGRASYTRQSEFGF